MNKNCVICNKEFKTNRNKQKCCSKECSKQYKKQEDIRLYNLNQKKEYIIKCINCQKDFITTKSHQNKCSLICAKIYEKNRLKQSNYYKKKDNIKHVCKICNIKFLTNKSYKFTCSDECKKQNLQNISQKWYNKKNKTHLKNCIVCNRLFQTKRKYKKNCSKECYKIWIKINNQQKYLNNLLYRTKVRFRNNVGIRLKQYNIKKNNHVNEYLGCSISQYIIYLESKFKPGMNWNNQGIKGWQIHHKKPLFTFNLLDNRQCKEAFHYTNTIPVWWYEHIKIHKNDKLLKNIQKYKNE